MVVFFSFPLTVRWAELMGVEMEEEGAGGGGVGQYAHDVQPLSRGLDVVKLFVGQLPR
jgi:hypothetical protein